MRYTITELGDGITRLRMNFADESVDLECETVVGGDSDVAEGYVSVFEHDMRANFRHLFPMPEPEHEVEGGEE